MATYRLHRWSVTQKYDNPFMAPEINPICLRGYRDADNKFVRTSPIQEVNGREITTVSGSVYILDDIDPEYRDWMEENGVEYDPENPIRIKRVS